MRKNRLIHDAAYAGATVLTERMEDALRPEERKKFHRQAYEVIKATIEGYDRQKGLETPRLGPSRN
jgi:hypothetical protein